MSFTPGPWSWWTSNSYMRLTAEGKQDGGVLSAVSHAGFATVRVSEADARLIAAAPDLLKALARLADLAEKFNVSGVYFDEVSSVNDDAILAAYDAIAKATGEPA